MPRGILRGMRYINHAFRYTLSSLGGPALFFSVLAIPAVGFALHFWLVGQDAMKAEFRVWLVYGLAATGFVFLALFAFNLACAPYRMERDAHLLTLTEVDRLRAQLPVRTKRRLNDEQKGLLASAIRRSGVSPPSFNVSYFVNDESADFAIDLGDAIRQAGKDCAVLNSPLLDHDPKDRGVKVYHSDERTISIFAEKFREGMKEVGFDCELRHSKHYGSFFVYVARSVET